MERVSENVVTIDHFKIFKHIQFAKSKMMKIQLKKKPKKWQKKDKKKSPNDLSGCSDAHTPQWATECEHNW